jgi:transcriptional regulator with XRE-family HTH domain
MDVVTALALVKREASRSSQARVAERIGVPRDALTRWKAGGSPTGRSKEKLLAWAQALIDEDARPAVPAPSLASEARALLDPVAQLVAEGQAEQAAWVLEFAARLLEAGAKRLRQGAQREAIIEAVEGKQDEITRPRTSRPQASEA